MSYEFDGEKYKNSSKHQKEWGNRIISEITIKEDFVILDLGCGDSVITQNLSYRAPKGKGNCHNFIEVVYEVINYKQFKIYSENFQ